MKGIELYGTGVHNRGAELMAYAVSERLAASYPELRIGVPATFGPYRERAKYGFWVTNDFYGRGRRARWLAKMATPAFLKETGILPVSECSLVLDASGFSFSDQWGPQKALELEAFLNKPERRGHKLIFLPQAFGPFEEPKVADVCRRLFAQAEIVFARDVLSQGYVDKLMGEPTARLSPDFTIAIKPAQITDHKEDPRKSLTIVPNIRMTDKLSAQQVNAYFKLLSLAVESFASSNIPSRVLLHDKEEDRRILPELFKWIGNLPVIEHEDPRMLKAELGRSHSVIGSRFHALVGALSQAVPTIAIGWSHKYPMLFQDFACPEMVLKPEATPEDATALFGKLIEPEARAQTVQHLKTAKESLSLGVESMWLAVEKVLSKELPG